MNSHPSPATPPPPDVAAAMAGDKDAFGRLYRTHYPQLKRIVSARMTGHSHGEVDDIVSEVFLKAWKRIGTYQWTGTNFQAWLTTIAINQVIDHFKSSRVRHVTASTDLLPDDPDPSPGPEEEAITSLHNARISEVLKQVLPRLTKTQRQCLELRFYQGLDVAETSIRMGIHKNAVKAQQHRATRTIKRLLQQQATRTNTAPPA